MRLHRFIGEFPLSQEAVRIQDKAIADQLRRVLRVHVGENILLGDGAGKEAEARILKLSRDAVEVEILKRWNNDREPAIRGTLYCSLLKRENFEFVLQKATEAGISAVVPVVASRTVKLNFKQERGQKIIKEAAEQSGRGIIPALSEPRPLRETLSAAHETAIVFEERGEVGKPGAKAADVGIWIGPEGGWTEEELEQFRAGRSEIRSLGPLTLRSETAAIIASYLVTHP